MKLVRLISELKALQKEELNPDVIIDGDDLHEISFDPETGTVNLNTEEWQDVLMAYDYLIETGEPVVIEEIQEEQPIEETPAPVEDNVSPDELTPDEMIDGEVPPFEI